MLLTLTRKQKHVSEHRGFLHSPRLKTKPQGEVSPAVENTVQALDDGGGLYRREDDVNPPLECRQERVPVVKRCLGRGGLCLLPGKICTVHPTCLRVMP